MWAIYLKHDFNFSESLTVIFHLDAFCFNQINEATTYQIQ